MREQTHAVLVHFGPQYTPEGIPETHTHYIHPPYTISSSFRLWGRDCLTRCQAEFTCLTTDWVLGIGKGSAVIGQFSGELHISANNLSCTLGLTENKDKAINEAVYIQVCK